MKNFETTLIELIKLILTEQPGTRDNDNKLEMEVHKAELKILGYPQTRYFYVKGKDLLSKPESIVRLRRIIQRKNPELQGEKRQRRLDNQKRVIREVKEVA